MIFKVVLKEDYLINKNKYIDDIKNLYLNDDNKLVNIDDICKHLDFIFSISNSWSARSL